MYKNTIVQLYNGLKQSTPGRIPLITEALKSLWLNRVLIQKYNYINRLL